MNPINTQPQLLALIGKMVNNKVNEIFIAAHKIAATTGGDIYPEMQLQLDSIQQALTNLITSQVMINLPDQQEAGIELFNSSLSII